MRHLIVFDLDGTLIDSRRDLADSANEMLEAYGAPPLGVDQVTGMVGEGARILVGRALVAAGVGPDVDEALGRFLEIYARRLTTHTRFYPGVPEAIEELVGRAWLAVLTNKPEQHTRLILEHFGVAGRFAWVIGGDSGFPRKPDPASLRHLIGRAGVAAERTLYVGDSTVDVETARAAGTGLCVAGYGFSRLTAGAVSDGPLSLVERPEQLADACLRFLTA